VENAVGEYKATESLCVGVTTGADEAWTEDGGTEWGKIVTVVLMIGVDTVGALGADEDTPTWTDLDDAMAEE
jgi:hypothetical protein